jgi:uncharacterized membrane protein YdjX (TVP38/TMEM64 family)
MLSRAVRRVVLGALIAAFAVGAIALWRTGVATPSEIRAWLDSLGPVAPVLFLVVFVGGSFLGLPGVACVIGGGLAFGPGLGIPLGYGGGMTAITLQFVATRRLRRVDGPPWRPSQRLIARGFDLLATHPFRGVVVLRLLMWFSAPLSYALAFSPVPLRAYVAGSAVALLPVTIVVVSVSVWLAET